MRFSCVTAGLLALSMVSSVEMAEAEMKPLPDDVRNVAVPDISQYIDKIRQFLAAGPALSKMKLPRLQQRLHQAESYRSIPQLPADLDQALQQEVARITREIISREQGATAPPPAAAEAPHQAEPQLEDPPLPPYDPRQAQDGQQPQADAQPQVAIESAAAAAFLNSVRPAAELDDAELHKQMRDAMEILADRELSSEQRRALRDIIRNARTTLRSRQQQAQPPAPPSQQPPVAEQPAPPPQPPVAEQPAPPRDQQLAKPAVSPALEQQAQAYLNDTTDVSGMKRKQLRKRLAEVRDLLATNQLSPQTREALRQKLARERAVLRSDVSGDAPAPQQQPATQEPPPPKPKAGSTTSNGSRVTIDNSATVNNTDIRIVLQDRRPPDALDDRELVRRIDVYRDVVDDDRYDEEQRLIWQRQMEEDRRYLRQQMMQERRQREAQLRQGYDQFNRDIQDRYEPGYDVPDDVFAAEADDSEIADVLAAPPRRQVERRYTVDDIERSPRVREAVARIEIDTVHFGFGEGDLREEEIDKLDRIARVLEKILARHPDEVFLIEGHTDAVGSDAANLVLSRQRAAAVKEALTTYYVIPAQNLKTVGLGERYLKIPTDQPEAENRRVSLARITPLVGQAD